MNHKILTSYLMYANYTLQATTMTNKSWGPHFPKKQSLYCYRSWTETSKMADNKFYALEQNLEMFIENTRQLGIIVSDFQPQGQNVLNQKL